MNPNQTAISKTEFIESVLRLAPALAVFDCDGTLWSGDAGEGFFTWEMKHGMVPDDVVRWARARYAEYLKGNVSEDDMCGEMVTINRGLSEAEVERAAAEYFDGNIAQNIFPELQELVARLAEAGCELWAVSSTNNWVIEAALRHFAIPPDHVLAACVEIDDGIITDRLIRVPSGEGKPRAIHEIIRRNPDAAFGNSRWDADMLKIAKHAFAVNANPDLEALAHEQGWIVYLPEAMRL
jgi:HAD superfamily phosphoserine phosphatase-like hydrolase